MATNSRIKAEIENDGRWIAEVIGMPGVLAYGRDKTEAVHKVKALALRVMDEQLTETARRFLDEQFSIMRKHGAEPKLSKERYAKLLAETKRTIDRLDRSDG